MTKTLWKVTIEGNPHTTMRYNETLAYFEDESGADSLLEKNEDFHYVRGKSSPRFIMKKKMVSPFIDEDLARILGVKL